MIRFSCPHTITSNYIFTKRFDFNVLNMIYHVWNKLKPKQQRKSSSMKDHTPPCSKGFFLFFTRSWVNYYMCDQIILNYKLFSKPYLQLSKKCILSIKIISQGYSYVEASNAYQIKVQSASLLAGARGLVIVEQISKLNIITTMVHCLP